jgi:type II secretory pathway component GspD/PulD (secretin)
LKKAIAEQGVIAPIGSPQVLAMNNEPALIRIGDDVTGGLTLAVVAQISADGIVQMHVSPSYSARAGQSKSSDGTVIAAAERGRHVVARSGW